MMFLYRAHFKKFTRKNEKVPHDTVKKSSRATKTETFLCQNINSGENFLVQWIIFDWNLK